MKGSTHKTASELDKRFSIGEFVSKCSITPTDFDLHRVTSVTGLRPNYRVVLRALRSIATERPERVRLACTSMKR